MKLYLPRGRIRFAQAVFSSSSSPAPARFFVAKAAPATSVPLQRQGSSLVVPSSRGTRLLGLLRSFSLFSFSAMLVVVTHLRLAGVLGRSSWCECYP